MASLGNFRLDVLGRRDNLGTAGGSGVLLGVRFATAAASDCARKHVARSAILAGTNGNLAAHEFGHYLLTLYYRVPSTPPMFIPFPLSPLGTFGAVIAMHGGEADRREIFDIGLAGPLAGLVVTIPVLIWGLLHPQPFEYAPFEVMEIGQPLLFQWIAAALPASVKESRQLAPTLARTRSWMAGWVGLLVTDSNMIPLGQLDGGHVAFGLMGGKSRYLGMAVAAAAASYMIYAQVFLFAVMLFLAIMMGFRASTVP